MKIQSQVYFLVALGVVSTDAWFWSWTGTTTLAPTPAGDTEGSGSPAGSGDTPVESFAKLGAEIIDEGHGFQNIVQTWSETTVAPVLTTTMQLQNENGSETEPAGISSPISEPGNGTSLFKGYGSGTGNVSKLKPEIESESRSESGFESGYETNWESGIETVVSPNKNQQEGLVPGYYQELDNRSSVMSQDDEQNLNSQRTFRITHTTKDNSGSTETAATSNNTLENGWNPVSFNLSFLKENSSHGDELVLIKSNQSGDTLQLIQNNQAEEISQVAVGGLAAKQEVLRNQVLEGSPGLVVRQMLSPNQTQLSTSKTTISYQQTAHKKSDDSWGARVFLPSPSPQRVPTSPEYHIQTHATSLNQTAEGSGEQGRSPKCWLLATALPFCSSMTGEAILLPNYLNHSTVAEVQALLHSWAWLLKSRCHHSLEWFFCLLLAPKCGSLVPPPLPCRSFCEVLKDSCWTLLDEGRLPVECHALPDEEDDGYRCLSVSNQKGKRWLK